MRLAIVWTLLALLFAWVGLRAAAAGDTQGRVLACAVAVWLAAHEAGHAARDAGRGRG
jgi:hypothetical protein